jgi:hypothetical protein
LPTFPDFDGQKKQYFYDLSDNFLTLNVWKRKQSLKSCLKIQALSIFQYIVGR